MPLIRTSNTDLVRIDLPAEGEWVEVKRALGKDEERLIQKRVKSAVRVDPATGSIGLDFGEAEDVATFGTLGLAIRKWSFKEPVTPAAIRALDDASLDAIKERLNELYPGPLGDAEKNG